MTYAGFSNQETFNASVVIDDDEGMSEQVDIAVERYDDNRLLGDEIQLILVRRLELVGSGYGRHALMDLVRTVQFVGSTWRINWNELAEHYRERAK